MLWALDCTSPPKNEDGHKAWTPEADVSCLKQSGRAVFIWVCVGGGDSDGSRKLLSLSLLPMMLSRRTTHHRVELRPRTQSTSTYPFCGGGVEASSRWNMTGRGGMEHMDWGLRRLASDVQFKVVLTLHIL